MHYYKRNLGDYAKKAGRLSMLQHGAFTLLIDACYDREQFPTLEEAIDWSWASSSAEIEAVEFVLRKFFVLEDGRYVQKRIQEEIDEYHKKAETNARIAAEREASRKEKRTSGERVVHEPCANVNEAPPNQEPRTKNQEPQEEKPKARSADAAPFVLPEFIPADAWRAYVEMRTKLRKPMTPHARDLVIKSLRRMHEVGIDIEVVLNNSTLQCWTNVYPPKGDLPRAPVRGGSVPPAQLADINAEAKRLLFGSKTSEVIDA